MQCGTKSSFFEQVTIAAPRGILARDHHDKDASDGLPAAVWLLPIPEASREGNFLSVYIWVREKRSWGHCLETTEPCLWRLIVKESEKICHDQSNVITISISETTAGGLQRVAANARASSSQMQPTQQC